MSIASMSRMLMSETEGWGDLLRIHPSVNRLMWVLVVPMSMIPALMFAYSGLLHPGAVFPSLEPPLRAGEATLIGAVFVGIEVGMVLLMSTFIQQAAESAGVDARHEEAFTLAAIAPMPLWLSSLVLFIPSLWVNVLAVAVAWVGCVALIRHGIRPLFKVEDRSKIRRMANAITFAGVCAWTVLLIVQALLVGLLLGWR